MSDNIELTWCERGTMPSFVLKMDDDAAEWLCAILETAQPRDSATKQLRRAIEIMDEKRSLRNRGSRKMPVTTLLSPQSIRQE